MQIYFYGSRKNKSVKKQLDPPKDERESQPYCKSWESSKENSRETHKTKETKEGKMKCERRECSWLFLLLALLGASHQAPK